MGYSDLQLWRGGPSVSALQEKGTGLHQSQPQALWQWMHQLVSIAFVIVMVSTKIFMPVHYLISCSYEDELDCIKEPLCEQEPTAEATPPRQYERTAGFSITTKNVISYPLIVFMAWIVQCYDDCVSQNFRLISQQ